MIQTLAKLYYKYEEIIWYVIIGVFTTAVDWCVFMPITHFFGDVIYIGHMDVVMYIAYVLAWTVSIIYSFISNKFVVFHSEGDKNSKQQFIKFALSRAVSLLISVIGAFIFDTCLGFNTYIVKIVFSIVVVVFNYFAGKFFVFGGKKKA